MQPMIRVILACGLAGASFAAQPPAASPPANADPVAAAQAFIKGLDKNGDGVLDKSETKGFPLDADFDKIDSNKDGRIDAAELAAFKAKMGNPGAGPPPGGAPPAGSAPPPGN